jgi:cation:H+ antiporter
MDFLTLVLFIIGLVFLITGAEWLVRGASGLAAALGISPLVIGLTVVAFGTSAPELAVGVRASLFGQPGETDIALGNVVGSNIANILLILGLASIFAPLIVHKQLLRFDVWVMLGTSFLLWLMASDGLLSSLEGLMLFLGILLYTGWSIHASRKQEREEAQARSGAEQVEKTQESTNWLNNILLLISGLTMLIVGSDWLVNGASQVARVLGVSELVIGLTIVAVGTSLPEVATTIAATIKGKRDLAVGNAVGSNIFNILLILGATALVSVSGIPVSQQAFTFDLPVMILVSVLCLPIFFTEWAISRWEGALMLGYYVAYLLYLVLKGMDSSILPAFNIFMIVCFLLTGAVLVVDTVRTIWMKRQQPFA